MPTPPPTGRRSPRPARRRGPVRAARAAACLAGAAGAGVTGCQAFHPLEGVPAETLSEAFRTPVRTPRHVIDLSLLGQPRPAVYRHDTGDVLGIYINTILGPEGIEPPPTLSETTLNLIPGVGTPFEVGRDGTIVLPEIGPVFVRGLTRMEITNRLKQLAKQASLGPDDDPDEIEDPKVSVSILKERTVSVVVFRDEVGPDGASDNNQIGIGGARFDEPTGQIVELNAYENDVLHALAATGGPPNLEGETTVTVTRAGGLRLLGCGPAGCGPLPPAAGGAPGLYPGTDGPVIGGHLPFGGHSAGPFAPPVAPAPPTIDGPQVIKIPLRLLPGQAPGFCHSDVILRDGDAVYVSDRTEDVFFTGGLLGPGSFRLPRDTDLDVLEALAVVQGQRPSVGTTRALTGNSSLSRDVTAGASSLIVLRKRPDGTRFRIEVDLRDAIEDPRQRIFIKPDDYLILQYRRGEACVAAFERFFIDGLILGISSGITFGN